MKALRAIKIILFIAAIVCLLVSATGNFFILKDACDNEVTAQEVHEALDNYEFKIGSLFKGKAEGAADDSAAADTADSDVTAPTTDEANPSETVNETVNETENAAEEVPEGAYKAGDHIGIINGLMKAGNARINLSFLKDIKIDLCKFGAVTMRDAEKPVFEVNLWLAISFVALTLTFILHLFTKHRRKTFWGIILMIFGYILFTAFFALGQLLANADINVLSKTAVEDFASYRIYVVCACCVLGCLIGLGYVRCGSRAMTIHTLALKLKKRKRASEMR